MHVHLPDSGATGLRAVTSILSPNFERPLADASLIDGIDAARLFDATGAIRVDLYCLSCGYNLRGLRGEPVLCPECGAITNLRDAMIPAPLIAAALRSMESAPTGCVACAIGAVLFGLGGALGRFYSMFLAAFLLIGVWFLCRRIMRLRFQDQPGWKRILFDFHLATFLCTMLLPLVGLGIALINTVHGDIEAPVMILSFLFAVPPFVLGLRVYLAARRRLAAMQRDRAVIIARETMLKTLQRVRSS